MLAAGFAVVVVGAGDLGRRRRRSHGIGTVAFLAMAAALGSGSGATFALIAKVTDPARVGGVTGLVGAAGGLGGFVPPLIMGYVYGRTDSYAIGLWLLLRHRRAAPCCYRHRRPPYRRPGTGSSLTATAEAAPRPTSGWTAPSTEALVRSRRFFTKGDGLRRPADPAQDGRPRGRRLLPGPVEPRQGRALHPRRELHGLLLVEGLRQGRDHHLGDPADRLPLGRARTRPEYEPRGCPRGAAFSWYTYSPTRVRYPYVRGVLLQMFREAKAQHDGDPVRAWEHIVENPLRAKAYKSARGKGGLVRATWEEATEIVAAAHVHTIKKYGPDRVAGFSPIPAMSMVSHASGARFVNLIGGSMLSFYDWYADLPVASPQVFGDQTDVPESGDWWNAGYLIMWGSNLPVTRTPDAHWMTEARYRGQKVDRGRPRLRRQREVRRRVAARQARHRRRAGDGDGPRRAQGVLRRPADAVLHRLRQDATPTCPTWSASTRPADGEYTAGQVPHRRRPRRPRRRGERRLQDRAHRRRAPASRSSRTARSATATATPASAGGTSTSATSTRCSRCSTPPTESVVVRLPRFDTPDGAAADLPRGVPVRRVGGHLVTTVFDLLLAQYGVGRAGPARASGPTRLRRRRRRRTPRPGRRPITGVPAADGRPDRARVRRRTPRSPRAAR